MELIPIVNDFVPFSYGASDEGRDCDGNVYKFGPTPTDSLHNSQFTVSQLPQEFCLRRSPQLCNPAVGMAFQGLPWPTSLPPSCGS